MNTMRKSVLGVLSAVVLGTPGYASAAELGFYVGGLYGKTDSELGGSAVNAIALTFYNEVLDFAPTTRASRFDSNDTTWGFFGGYRLLPNLAFEGGYTTLSKEVIRENATGVFLGTGEIESWSSSFGVSSTGFALSALGILPITYNWEVFVRGGVFFASNTLSYYVVRDDGLGGADQLSKSSTDFLAGIGAGYTLAEVYQLRAEFQRIFDAGSEDYGEADLDMFTVGVTVKF